MSRRGIVGGGLVVILLGALPTLQGTGLRINLTPSEPRGLYLVTNRPRHRGRLIVFDLSPTLTGAALADGYALSGKRAGSAMPGLKRLVALPGDTVEVGPQGVSINGVLWPDSKPLARDSNGRQIRHYRFGFYRVRPNEIWVLSDNPRGWDSRYFGPVTAASVIGTAEPLFTVE